MADTAADVITAALTHHRRGTVAYRRLAGPTHLVVCTCGAQDMAMGDRWEAHLADVTVAALTQAGLFGVQPVTYRAGGPIPAGAVVTASNAMPDVRWRAAALEVVAAWTTPGRMPQLHAAAQEQLDTHWPSLAGPIRRLVQAKAELLGGR